MLEKINSAELQYQKLTPEEMKRRGILGRLVGPIADTVNPTRNGRKYSEELWEKAFSNPITQERIKNGLFFGEIEHPEGRTQTDPEKIAVCMREQPKKNNKGQLVAVLDILDTPNGRILKTLCDYGSTLGISSRGTGEVIQDEEGNDIVDPTSYECEAFDIVSIPAVETARLQYVTESLNGKTLNEALKEDIKKADEKSKKIMEETLKDLKIDIKENTSNIEVSESGDNPQINEVHNSNKECDISGDKESGSVVNEAETVNDGTNELIKNFKESLKTITSLERTVQDLQEKLAISNAKVDELTEENNRFKQSVINLSVTAKKSKEMAKKISDLEESLEEQKQVIIFKNNRITKLLEDKRCIDKKSTSLNETISSKDIEITKLNSNLEQVRSHYESKINDLNESIKKISGKLADSCKSQKASKELAESAVKMYIDFRAKTLGVSANEITNKLPDSYTLGDVDAVCEDLKGYKLSINKLPLAFDRQVKVRVTESKQDKVLTPDSPDDEVDESLLKLAGLKK